MVIPLPNLLAAGRPQPHAVFLIAIPRSTDRSSGVDRFFFLTVHCQVAIIIFTASAGSEYPQNRTDLTGSRGII